MEPDAELTGKISQAIAPFATSTEKPPYNEEQLIILAILSLRKAASGKEIFDWIVENFYYYDQLARTSLWVAPYVASYQSFVPVEGRPAQQFRSNFAKVFQQYEVPLTTESASDGTLSYNIPTVEGWRRVADVIEPETSDKVFPFFDLPPEIRNSIYEYMFRYPESGVKILQADQQRFCRGLPGPRMLGILDRSIDHEFTFEKWDEAANYQGPSGFPYADLLLRSQPLSTILAPLLTCRQFFEEAMPLFYSLNRFYFHWMPDMYNTLFFLAPSRRKLIKHVSFNFTKGSNSGRDLDVAALKQLHELEGLRKLDIRVRPGAATALKGPNARGLHTLCRLRDLEEVIVSGECDKIKARVMASLLLPKPDTTISKKRKRQKDDSEDGDDMSEAWQLGRRMRCRTDAPRSASDMEED